MGNTQTNARVMAVWTDPRKKSSTRKKNAKFSPRDCELMQGQFSSEIQKHHHLGGNLGPGRLGTTFPPKNALRSLQIEGKQTGSFFGKNNQS